MRSTLVLLAALAGSSLALPTDVSVDRRNLAPVGDIVGGALNLAGNIVGETTAGVSGLLGAVLSLDVDARLALLTGLKAHGAAALEGGVIGCKAVDIRASARAELKAWLNLPTQTRISGDLKAKLIAWCDNKGALTLDAKVAAELAVFVPDCATIAAEENLYVTIDGIFASVDLEASLILQAKLQASLKVFLQGALSLDLDIKAGLQACATGGLATGLKADVKVALFKWLSGDDCALNVELKAAVLAWIHADVSLKAGGALSVNAQASVKAFLEADLGLKLEDNIKAGLRFCAGGKLASELDVGVHTDLVAWLSSSKCSLTADLKASVGAWIHVGLNTIGSVPESGLTAISVGASVGALVKVSGELSASAQASIAAFLKTELGIKVKADLDLEAGLQACADAKLAASLTLAVRTKLAIWLSSAECTLGAQLKAVVLLWLSVGAKADVSVDLVGNLLGHVSGFLSESVIASLSVNLRVALGLLAGGESLVALSWETRAELAALISGCTTIDIKTIHVIVIQWFTGCKVPGAPAPSSVPTLPSSTPVVSITASNSISVPAPTGAKSTSIVPAGSETTAPAGSETTAPAGSETTAPAGSETTAPAGAEFTGSAPSGTVPSGPSETGSNGGPGESVSVPSGPATTAPPAAGVPSVYTTTITRTHTVCNCE